MTWDPGVLRKYNTTGHFRLLNQLRLELKASPLVRPRQGQSVGEVNRSRSLIRAIAEKAAAMRNRRLSQGGGSPLPAQVVVQVEDGETRGAGSDSGTQEPQV